MFSGHFGLALILQKRFPTTSPYILCIGVQFMDIIFGLIAWTGLEGLYKADVPTTPYGTVGLRCNYTHSLIGSLLLSGLYGYATGSLIPGFVASWSHFVLDWVVHRSDMYLDPFSKLVVGGIGLWDRAPAGAFLLETLLIIGAGIYAPKDPWTLGTGITILLFHLTSPYSNTQNYEYFLSLDEVTRGYMTTLLLPIMLILPGLLMGYTLTRASRHSFRPIE